MCIVQTNRPVLRNLSVAQLVEQQLANQEGVLGNKGEIICHSGKFTGRSPDDKYFVKEAGKYGDIDWGNVNKPITPEIFDLLYNRVLEFLVHKQIYVHEGYCGADSQHRIGVRFYTQKAWHAHFVRNMFITPTDVDSFSADFTVINACDYFANDYKQLGLNSETFLMFHIGKRLAIIAGTQYAGEMKKGIFSVMNYLLPQRNVLPMHCAANTSEKGDVVLFFGLSGTGKTTLSADPKRQLIGDDEHGWSDNGIFNFEGGCYAKTSNLSAVKEPQIWNAIRFGAILENCVYDKGRKVDFSDSSITENTRVSYPIEFIDNFVPSGMGGHPSAIVFLTCDVFGVLPPLSHLTPKQAVFHFLNGYTSKVAGTERGVAEPQAVFSPCFGSPFMTRAPEVYGQLLAKKLSTHTVPVYLVNTGWTGGGYGIGRRIDLEVTRKIIDAIIEGNAASAQYKQDNELQFSYAIRMEGISPDILEPKRSWKNADEYKATKKNVAQMFARNFAKFGNIKQV